jgi:hypothetical protein
MCCSRCYQHSLFTVHFPETPAQVSAAPASASQQGSSVWGKLSDILFSRFTFKVGGPLAAYLITVWLGYSLVTKVQDLIASMTSATWTISGEVELRDSNGQQIGNSSIIDSLDVLIMPPTYTKGGGSFELQLPGEGADVPDRMVTLSIPTFGAAKPFNLRDSSNLKDKDEYNRKLKLIPVVIQQFPPAPGPETPVQPVKPGEGPPVEK